MQLDGRHRWRVIFSQRTVGALWVALPLACLCVSTASAAFSSVPYYDDFSYANASSLVGTNGWTTFTTGPGYGILPDPYHGWVGYAGGRAIASNDAARLTGIQLVNRFGDYTGEPGIGAPTSTGLFDKPAVATIRFRVDLSETSSPTNGLHQISRMGNMFWPGSRWHYENQSSYYTMMPVVRAFVRTNGLVTAYDGNVMTNLTHTPITNAATITLTLNYETFKWSLWVDNTLAAADLGLYKPYMGNSPATYTHMLHDGWYKDYDGLKEIGFVDNTGNGGSLIDRLRVFADTPASKAMPLIENFETRVVNGATIEILPGNVNGQNGFFASAATVTTDAQSDGGSPGSQGAQINSGGEIFQLFLDQKKNVWSDLWLSPVVSAGGVGTAVVDLGGGHAVFYVDKSGDVYAYDGASPTNIAAVATNAWGRFTVQQDYTASTWDLYVDSALVQSNLAFRSEGIADCYEEFRVSSMGDAVVQVDDIVIGTESPFNIPSVTFDTDAVEVAVGVTEVTVTASLSWAFGQTITVDYVLQSDGTAMQVYNYSASNGTFTFLPGETEKSFSFTITRTDGNYAEYDDSLVFALTNTFNVNLGAHDQLTYSIRTNPEHYYVIPFSETFEYRDPGTLDGQRGWVSTYVSVQSNDVYAGSQAAYSERLGASLAHAFSNEAMNVSVQWREKLVLAQHEPTPPAGSTYAFYVSSNGYVVAFNGSTSTNLGNVVTLSEGTWTQFKVNADYNTKKWTLFVNGTQVLQDFDFFDTSATSFGGFEVQGQFTLDNIAIDYGPPATPANLTAIAYDGQVDLSWSLAQGTITYRLKRGTNPGGPYSLLASLRSTNYVDTSAINDITYYYVVSALNAMGEGNNSDAVQATPRAKVTGLTATAGIGQITLDWDAYSGATNYYIKRGTVSGGPYTTIASTNVNSYVDTTAANGRTYYYVVYAETAVYTSLDSDEVAQAPALRTIFYDSFESPVVDLVAHENMLIPNWEIRKSLDDSLWDRGGIVDSGTSPQEFAPRHGNQCAWLWSEAYIETTGIQEVLEEEAYYKLSFNVAAEFGLGDIYYKVELLAGDTVLNDVTASWDIMENDFERSDVIEFTTPIGHAAVGEPLKIRVRYHSGDWNYVMGVDNVRLETAVAPPPVLPDPLTFSVAPAPVVGTKTKIDMTTESVTNGVGPILYNFENVTTGDASGWSDLTSWENIGLTPGTEYGFRVRARDTYGNMNEWSAVSYAETFGANLMTNNATAADSWNNTNNWKNSAAPTGEETARIATNIAAVVGSAPPVYEGNLILDADSSLEFTDAATAAVLPGSSYQIQLNAGSQLRAFTQTDIDAAIVLQGDAEVLGASGGDRITFKNTISGGGKLTLAGDAANEFYLNAANSMSGGVVTRNAGGGHTVFANVNSAFGSSDVYINTNASLYIGGGLNNVISNGATLYLNGAKDGSGGSSGYKVVIGSGETVYQLIIDGVVQPRGTHGGTDSGADYTNTSVFAGIGLLTVTVGDDDIYDLSTRDVTDSSAVLEGKLDVPFTSRVARVHWSTNINASANDWLTDANASTSVLNTYSEKVGQGLLKGLINLTQNTRYYYTFSASNTVDVIWGATETFETVGPPVVDNTGASATGDATATLAGVLTVGSFAEITFAWGDADDGTNSVYDWDHVVALSGLQAQDETFTTAISGLTYGKPYYYRIMGENALGIGWSDVRTVLSEAPHSGATMIVGVAGTQATNIAQTTATLQGELDAPRSVFTVHAYWSTNSYSGSAWETAPDAQTVIIGSYANASDIALSTDITNLTHDTTYYYTFVATNAATNIWASNIAFGTVGSPTVDSSVGASNVVGSIVTLQGELTDGVNADAYFVWDTEDKGISGTNAWTNIVSVGNVTEGYVFGSSVTGFIYGLEYTYRVYVTNDYGADWSTSQVFYALAPTSPDAAASGGSATNIYTDGDGNQWYAHIFTENDTFTAPEGLQVEYLIVGGGGGGGGVRGTGTAAGGGAGGVLAGTASVTSGAYPVVVGAGGAGEPGAYDGAVTGGRGDPGGNSSALGVTALGGGGGAYNNFTTGMTGGSGGGGAPSGGIGGAGTSGQGFAGGASGTATNDASYVGGGGGGAGGIGGAPDGGPGIVSDISGSNATYAAGGKGGARKVSYTQAGPANSGNGGSGGSWNLSYSGADGGSGIVIIRYEVVPGVDLSIVNTAVTNVADTAVDIQGELDAVSSIVDVYAYWSTNQHTDAAEWRADSDASNALVTTYNNVADQALSYSLTGLTADTTYYYTFMATNALTNLWATPAREFGTKGPPVASSAAGATNMTYGGATLQGLLTSGGVADAWFVWGKEDGLTASTGDWEQAEFVDAQIQAVPFAQTITGVLYGVEYDYRVFVSNEHAVGWSDVARFASTIPESGGSPLVGIANTSVSTIGENAATLHGELDATQSVFTVTAYWSTTNHDSLAAWDAGKQGSAVVGTYTNVTNQSFSYAATGLDANADYYFTFVASNVATNLLASPNGTFATEGPPTVNLTAVTNIGIGSADIQAALTLGGVADAWVVWATEDALTTSTGDWAYAASAGEVQQGNSVTNTLADLLYGVTYYARVYVTNAFGDDWSAATNFTTLVPAGVGPANEAVSNVGATTATLNGALDATQSVFTVHAFWSTNDNSDAAAWRADSTAQQVEIGTYTNVVGQALTAAVTGLDTATTYYYTFVASNVVGELWASPNTRFSTVDTPAVSADGATGASQGAVDLNGTLTGGHFAGITLVWGTTDQGATTTNSWTHSVPLGTVTQDIAFTAGVSNLLFGVPYQYRLFATNEAGSGWSTAQPFSPQIPQDGGILVGITAASVANVSATTADLGGALDATQSVFTVHAYWSTNNNTGEVEWSADTNASTGEVGTYTNVSGEPVALSVSGLAPASIYYFTMTASNSVTNIWADSNISFETIGTPVVDVAGGETNVGNGYVGKATLRGQLTSGALADAYIVWGTSDAGTTNTADWQHTVSVGEQSEGTVFATQISNLLYGVQYYYRVYVTNELAAAWSAVEPFLTTPPEVQWTPANTDVVAWYDAADTNTITLVSGLVSQWDDKSGNGLHATQSISTRRPAYTAVDSSLNNRPSVGPGYAGSSGRWLTTPAMTNQNVYMVTYYNEPDASFDGGNHQNLIRTTDDTYYLQGLSGTAQWVASSTSGFTAYRDGNVASTTAALPMGPTLWTAKANNPVVNKSYNMLTYGTDRWRSWEYGAIGEIIFTDGTEDLATQQRLEGYLAHTWGTDGNLPVDHPWKSQYPGTAGGYSISNATVSNITATTADLHSVLDAPLSVYTVQAYVSTNENASYAAWTNDADKVVLVGDAYTNVVDQAITFTATGLTGGTTYYVSIAATNAATNLWSGSNVMFTTTGAPGVDNAGGATDVDTVSATLNGQLTNGSLASAYIVWGNHIPASSNVLSAWDTTIEFGQVLEGVTFSQGITGLTHSTTYYYRALVSNDIGTAWSSVTNFTTTTPAIYTGPDGGSATDTWNTDANWNSGAGTVPSNVVDVVIESDRSPWAVNATPAYTGRLTLQTNTTLGIGPTAGNNTVNALGTGPITLNSGSMIIMRYGTSYTFNQDIVLAGPATISLSESTSGRNPRTFDGSIHGDYVFTLAGSGGNTTTLSASNRVAGITTMQATGASSNWKIIAAVAGALGTGDVTISDTVNLVVDAANAMHDSAALHLNGAKSTTDATKLVMNADDTINQLYVDGVQQPGGAYTGGDESWISGAGVLTITDWPSSITNTSAYNVEPMTADLAGEISISNETFDVWVYWSMSNNVGSAAWLADNTASNMLVGSFSSSGGVTGSVANLTPVSTYYFTLRATNAFEDLWASPTAMFNTPGIPAVPVVTLNGGVTGVGVGEATLNGLLTEGGSADATIVWDTADGDTNSVSGWANQIPMAQVNESFAFSNTVSGLLYGPQYAYRVYATNDQGEAWSGLDTFSTLPPTGADAPAITNAYATNVLETTADLVGVLDATQSVFTVSVYWSESNNVDSVAWLADGTASNSVLGTYTNVSDLSVTGAVANFSSGTAYYYTFVATNEATNIWSSPNGAFGTQGSPSVDTASGASGLGAGIATLNGRLIADGGSALQDVRIYFGTSDGGTTPDNWDTSYAFSPGAISVGDTFSTNVTDLLYGVEYRYRVYALNAFGAAWSDVATFLTTPPESPWTPAVMSEAVAWFDAADSDTIWADTAATTPATTTVGRWDDKSGNHNNFEQTTAGDRPSYNANDSRMNNMPTVGYDLARKYLRSTNTFAAKRSYLTTYYDAATFGSWHALSADAGNTVRIAGGQSGQTSFTDVGIATSYKDGSSVTNYASGVTVLPMGPTLWNVTFDATTTDEWLLLSGTPSYGGWENGALGEIVYTDGTEDLTGQQKLEGYLAHKWGTESNLPSDHPYMDGAPGIPGNFAITNATATNVLAASADIRGTLDATQSVFTVTAYWSTISNATAQAWLDDGTKGIAQLGSYTNVVGQSLNTSATGLADGTTYYYTFVATNAATNIWALPNGSFTTVAALPPVVGTAGGATNIGVGVATLQGEVTAINGTLSDVRIYLGTDDGVTTPANWDTNFVIAVGEVSEGVTFSTNVTGLLYGQEYAYRVYATNAFGATWSDAETNILTLAPAGIGVTNTPAANVTQLTADLRGELDATQSVFTVTAYWSTNDNADSAAWLVDGTKGSAVVGAFTNVMDQALSVPVGSLTPGTTYYYTFMATNAATNIWASPNGNVTTAPSPVLDSVTPADGATEVALDAQLVANFNSLVALVNGGVVTVTNITDGTATVITLPNAQVAVVDSTNLVINLTADFAEGKTYAVLIGPSAILAYTGINTTNTWAFTTATPSVTPPTLLSVSPLTGATEVDPALVLQATFDKDVAANTGNIIITNINSGAVITIPVTDSQVTISGTNVTIDPTAYLDRGATYAVLIPNDVIRDTYGNAFAGITDANTWQFTTAVPGGRVLTVYGVTGNPGGNWPNYFGHLTDMLNGNLSYDFGVTDHNPGINTGAAPNDPSAWTFNPGNYQSEWSPNTGYQDPATSLNNKIAWVVMDLGSETADLASMFLWNNTTTAVGSQVDTYNVYYSSGAGIDALPAMPKSKGFAGDYDFGSGDWTKLNTSGVLTLPVNTSKPRTADASVNLNGVSARYVAIEIVTNHGHASAVGLGQVELTAYDTSRPSITNTSPAHLASDVPVNTTLTAEFDEQIAVNSGNIVIMNLTSSTRITIPISDAQVAVSGTSLTITPSSDLGWGATHAIMIDPGAVTDSAGNGFAGITDTATWRFTTELPFESGSVFRFK